jgi:hypothetical protein
MDQHEVFKRKLLNSLYKEFMGKEGEFISADILKQYVSEEEAGRHVLERLYPFVPFEELRWIAIAQMAKGPKTSYAISGPDGKIYNVSITKT